MVKANQTYPLWPAAVRLRVHAGHTQSVFWQSLEEHSRTFAKVSVWSLWLCCRPQTAESGDAGFIWGDSQYYHCNARHVVLHVIRPYYCLIIFPTVLWWSLHVLYFEVELWCSRYVYIHPLWSAVQIAVRGSAVQMTLWDMYVIIEHLSSLSVTQHTLRAIKTKTIRWKTPQSSTLGDNCLRVHHWETSFTLRTVIWSTLNIKIWINAAIGHFELPWSPSSPC